MGLHSDITTKNQSRRNKRKLKRIDKKMRKASNQKVGEVVDAGLITAHHLRKRNTSPRANITLSGKKRRKLLKQLKHMETDKNKMELEATTSTTESTQKKEKKTKKNEVDMSDESPPTETEAKTTTDAVDMEEME